VFILTAIYQYRPRTTENMKNRPHNLINYQNRPFGVLEQLTVALYNE
jgi:hypothetical protein